MGTQHNGLIYDNLHNSIEYHCEVSRFLKSIFMVNVVAPKYGPRTTLIVRRHYAACRHCRFIILSSITKGASTPQVKKITYPYTAGRACVCLDKKKWNIFGCNRGIPLKSNFWARARSADPPEYSLPEFAVQLYIPILKPLDWDNKIWIWLLIFSRWDQILGAFYVVLFFDLRITWGRAKLKGKGLWKFWIQVFGITHTLPNIKFLFSFWQFFDPMSPCSSWVSANLQVQNWPSINFGIQQFSKKTDPLHRIIRTSYFIPFFDLDQPKIVY